ncbi:MAG: hypothetical protein JRN46_03295 [Nitrososphaerota archaeon]|nr:hypothetical protein [Nitrososphaerota archaeon]
MSRRQKVVLGFGLVLVVAFVFGAPVVNESSPGGVAYLGDGAGSGYIHYQASIGCLLIGVGDMYWQGGLHAGCAPLVA